MTSSEKGIPMSELRNSEYVVIGGGAIGCAVAYALAKAGQRDVLVLERGVDVGQATTSQGAGLCGQVRNSVERVRLAMHSVATFRELQADKHVQPDWHEVGSIRIALSSTRVDELRRLQAVCDETGLDVELLDVKEAQRRWPTFDFMSAQAVLWCPSDGWMTPRNVVKAYEHQCRQLGVHFATAVQVDGIVVQQGRVTGLTTNCGSVDCRYAINAAGAHAYHVAKLVGLELPIVPVRHEYFVTVAMPGLSPDLPCFRVPELGLYGRVRDGGLLLGGWEPSALDTDPHSFPLHGSPPEVVADWSVLGRFESDFASLFPAARQAAKSVVGKGWPTFTPDGQFIIGESSQVKGFVMAGGCNAHGISGSGGISRLLVESLFDPNPSTYVRSLSPDRFTETTWTWDDARRNAKRVYETYYGV